jgi:hypothetical protein
MIKEIKPITDDIVPYNRAVRNIIEVFNKDIDRNNPVFNGKNCAAASLMLYNFLEKRSSEKGWSFAIYHSKADNWYEPLADGTGNYHCFLQHSSGLYVDPSNNKGDDVWLMGKNCTIESFSRSHQKPNDFTIEYMDRQMMFFYLNIK